MRSPPSSDRNSQSGGPSTERVVIPVEGASVSVSGLLLEPAHPEFLYVLAHGAGAGMRHPFLESMAAMLATRSISTLRYQFPYMEVGRKRPDPPHLLQATVRSAIQTAVRLAKGNPLLAGGKSMGGRMTSSAAAAGDIPELAGLAFLGFPLHPPGRPGDQRAQHLEQVDLPMLFLQGSRDSFADLELLRPVCVRLGSRATLHVVEGGDHSFKVLKKSGRTSEEVLLELAEVFSAWAAGLI